MTSQPIIYGVSLQSVGVFKQSKSLSYKDYLYHYILMKHVSKVKIKETSDLHFRMFVVGTSRNDPICGFPSLVPKFEQVLDNKSLSLEATKRI